MAELCTPVPRRSRGERWKRDYEEANQWSMTATMRDAVVARFCDRMPMTLHDAVQLAESAASPVCCRVSIYRGDVSGVRGDRVAPRRDPGDVPVAALPDDGKPHAALADLAGQRHPAQVAGPDVPRHPQAARRAGARARRDVVRGNEP